MSEKKTKKSPAEKKPKISAERVASVVNYLASERTAKQVASQYHLKNAVQAKRLIEDAIEAGAKIKRSKSEKPAGHVGRRPNVYASSAA